MNLLHPSHQIHHKQLSYGETVRYHPQRTVFFVRRTLKIKSCRIARLYFFTASATAFIQATKDPFSRWWLIHSQHLPWRTQFTILQVQLASLQFTIFIPPLILIYLYLRKGHRTSAYLPLAFCRVMLTAHIGIPASSSVCVHWNNRFPPINLMISSNSKSRTKSSRL